MVLGTDDRPAPGPEPGAGQLVTKRLLRGPLLSLLVALIVLALPLRAAGAAGAEPLLPDLGVAPLQHMLIEQTADGKKRLRFTASIANVGKGPIEIVGSLPRTGRGSGRCPCRGWWCQRST